MCVAVYGTVSQWWSYIAPMNHGRRGFGICTYNDLIYVVRGRDISTAESYDPVTNNCLTRVTNGNKVLDRLDPRDGKWFNLNGRQGTVRCELVSYDRTLFAIGDEDCKRLDIRVNKWKPMPHMLSKRYGFSAVIAAKAISVLGGREGRQFIRSVKRFNIHNNEWATVDSIQIQHFYAAVLSRDS
uniref:Uncharacterized protein n=1 Tax=Glossina austeni TaxID=7395 RepID=A0A1A9V7C8_GLOAU